jgi:DNA protecting protein DprA
MQNDSKLLKYLALTQMKGLGPITQNSLVYCCGGIDPCFEADLSDLLYLDESKLPKGSRIGRRRIQSFLTQREEKSVWKEAEKILKQSESSGIQVICAEDNEFPERFSNLRDLPVVLYVKGCLRINDFRESVGIVGARRCTAEGKRWAIDRAMKAVSRNEAVISGMAKGIDSYAHTAAIKASGYTIAVLGSGVDICYPKEHERLYEEIAIHGCVLSEYPPGTPPMEYNFPRRNRLIAGLSDRLYVIDAGRNSGTSSTVEYSRKYGREIIAD